MSPPSVNAAPSIGLAPSTPQPLQQPLREALDRAQFAVGDERADTLVAPLEGLAALPAEQQVVALHRENLGERLAQALRRRSPALALACRDGGLPSGWELRVLRSLLGGAPLKALLPAPAVTWRLESISDLQAAANHAGEATLAAGGKRTAAAVASDVAYELAANALLDAPVDEQGTPKYAYRRAEQPTIDAGDGCDFALAAEPGRLYVWVGDRYGRLTVGPVANAVAACSGGGQVNIEGGGAGLGLRRVIEHSDLFAAKVTEHASTEVVCTVELSENRRRAGGLKSLFFISGGR